MEVKRNYKLILWGVLVISFTGVLAAMMVNGRNRAKENVEAETPLPVLFTLPDFSLTERSGRTITKGTLAGKVWIADFIFTSCPSTCPKMTGAMYKLQEEFSDQKDLQLVSITVDPKRDTPELLKKYAAEHHASKGQWYFLTGDARKICDLSVKGFRLGDDPDSPMMHSTRFALVDRQGQIRNYYDAIDANDMKKLRTDIRRLLDEKSNEN